MDNKHSFTLDYDVFGIIVLLIGIACLLVNAARMGNYEAAAGTVVSSYSDLSFDDEGALRRYYSEIAYEYNGVDYTSASVSFTGLKAEGTQVKLYCKKSDPAEIVLSEVMWGPPVLIISVGAAVTVINLCISAKKRRNESFYDQTDHFN